MKKKISEWDELDNMLTWAENAGWVFVDGRWKQEGWKTRNTYELFLLFKRKLNQIINQRY